MLTNLLQNSVRGRGIIQPLRWLACSIVWVYSGAVGVCGLDVFVELGVVWLRLIQPTGSNLGGRYLLVMTFV
jgi:hypothetical protein